MPAFCQPPRALTLEEVVKLSQTGFADDLVITKIKKNAKAFDLSTEELLELKKAGVSDQVIKYLLDPSLPYSGPPPPGPAPGVSPAKTTSTPKQFPPDAFASAVPADPGVYVIRGQSPVRIDAKLLLGANEGPGFGKVLMKKGKTIAFLPGPVAKTRVTELTPLFYFRLPEGKGIEEVLLLVLEKKSDRREIEAGASGAKQEFKAEFIRTFESLEVGTRLFKLNPVKLMPGEYIFLQLGTAEPQKGTQGKAFDFSVDSPPAPR